MVFCDIASFYSPRGGGVKTYHDQKLAFFSRHRRHRYFMIAPAARDLVERRPGGTIYWQRGLPFDANYYHLVNFAALRRALRAIEPDVLEFGSPYLDYWLTALAARGLKPVTSAVYHLDLPEAYLRPFSRRYLGPFSKPLVALGYKYVKRIYGRLDSTLAASNSIKAKLQGLGLKNVKLLPLGVDPGLFHPRQRREGFRRSLGAGKRDKILFYAGRYRVEKGLDLILDAAPELLRDRALHLLFAGTGPDQSTVRALCARRPNAHDLGYISDKTALARAYASADGYLSPGQADTFGLGVVEALSSGVPVLSAGSGAGGEIIARFGCGLLFEPGSRADLARKIRALVRADFTPALARARRFLREHHSWDLIFASYVDHHEKLRRAKG
jgi:alpha-1,6-mannosyltransferase